MAHAFTPPATCPVCGESVPRGARACPGCGADERSGWNEDETRYDGLDLPNEAFADDATPLQRGPRSRGRLWLFTGLVLLAVLILSFILR
jgi:hypothetical protein